MTIALAFTYDRPRRDNAVLLLIDPQVGPLWELESAPLRRQMTDLAKTARRLAVPTIVTTIAHDDLGPIIPELSRAAADRAIERTVGNAWHEQRVRHAVESTRRRKLIVAGSVTDVGVAPCAIAAVEAGFDVYAPIMSAPTSFLAVRRMVEAGVIVTSFGRIDLDLAGVGARPNVLVCRGA